jgi:hypothetical protein
MRARARDPRAWEIEIRMRTSSVVGAVEDQDFSLGNWRGQARYGEAPGVGNDSR